MVLQETQKEIEREIKKLIWMKAEFVKATQKLLAIIKEQELKIIRMKKKKNK
jgi:hypothetical protein